MSDTGLTPAQEEAANATFLRGVEIVTSTQPIDECAAHAYAARLMDWLGRPFMGLLVVDSPMAACYAAHLVLGAEFLFPGYLHDKLNHAGPEEVAVRTARAFQGAAEPVLEGGSREAAEQVLDRAMRAAMREVWTMLPKEVWGSPKLLTDEEYMELAGRPQLILTDMDHRDHTRKGDLPLTPEGLWCTFKAVRNLFSQFGAYQALLDKLGETRKRRQSALQKTSERVGRFLAGWAAVTAHDQVQTVWPYLDGQFFGQYKVWFDFYQKWLGLEVPGLWQIEDQVEFGGVYPLNHYCVVSRRPQVFLYDSEYRFTADNRQALRYRDSFGPCYLNGVLVPEWLALTPAEELDPSLFISRDISNAEQRREFLRKVGVERVYQKMGGDRLDSQGDYELVRLNMGGSTGARPFLKMLNPSTGTWHLEGVEPKCRTVAEALEFRNKSTLAPEQLT